MVLKKFSRRKTFSIGNVKIWSFASLRITDAHDEKKLKYYLKINALFQKADWFFLRNATVFEKLTSFQKTVVSHKFRK